MAAAIAELEIPAGSTGTPEAKPAAATPKPEITTAEIEKQLRGLLEGEGEPKEPAEEQPAGDEGEQNPEIPTPKPEEESLELAAEGEDEDETPEEHKQQWPDSAQKRVDKLTAQRQEARERADGLQTEKDDLERQLNEAQQALEQQTGAAALPNDPLSFINTTGKLSEYVSSVKHHLRLIEDHFDGTLSGEGRAKLAKFAGANGGYDQDNDSFDDGKLKGLRRTAQDALNEYAPARLEYLKQEATASQLAEQTFPWLRDRKSAEYTAYQQVLQAMPEIRKVPHWKAVAAVYVRGLQAVQADQKRGKTPGANGKAATASKASGAAKIPGVKLPGAPNAVPQRPAQNGDDGVEALRQKALQSRDPKDWEKLVAAQLAMAA